MYCDVYKWRGHKYDTPLYNKELGNVDVIKKCRCGKTKTVTRYVPLPDTEEFKKLHEPESQDDELDEYEYESPLLNVKSGITGLIFLIISITVIANVMPAFKNAFYNATGSNIDIPTPILTIVLMLPPILVLVVIVSIMKFI